MFAVLKLARVLTYYVSAKLCQFELKTHRNYFRFLS